MIYLLQDVVDFLPLAVLNTSWDGDTLTFGGSSWRFSARCEWRVLAKNQLQFSSISESGKMVERGLVGLSVVGVQSQSIHLIIDPAFEFSDGSVIEIFSVDTMDPWELQLPNRKLYMGGT